MQMYCKCMYNAHVCATPSPPYNANTTARSQLRAFSLGVFKSSARSSFCGEGILPCKILISPRPLTTPRSVFVVKPKQGARSCGSSPSHAHGESARELRAGFLLLRMTHSARSSPCAGFEYVFHRFGLWLVIGFGVFLS